MVWGFILKRVFKFRVFRKTTCETKMANPILSLHPSDPLILNIKGNRGRVIEREKTGVKALALYTTDFSSILSTL